MIASATRPGRGMHAAAVETSGAHATAAVETATTNMHATAAAPEASATTMEAAATAVKAATASTTMGPTAASAMGACRVSWVCDDQSRNRARKDHGENQ
jgi:hypothetical protein